MHNRGRLPRSTDLDTPFMPITHLKKQYLWKVWVMKIVFGKSFI